MKWMSCVLANFADQVCSATGAANVSKGVIWFSLGSHCETSSGGAWHEKYSREKEEGLGLLPNQYLGVATWDIRCVCIKNGRRGHGFVGGSSDVGLRSPHASSIVGTIEGWGWCHRDFPGHTASRVKRLCRISPVSRRGYCKETRICPVGWRPRWKVPMQDGVHGGHKVPHPEGLRFDPEDSLLYESLRVKRNS